MNIPSWECRHDPKESYYTVVCTMSARVCTSRVYEGSPAGEGVAAMEYTFGVYYNKHKEFPFAKKRAPGTS